MFETFMFFHYNNNLLCFVRNFKVTKYAVCFIESSCQVFFYLSLKSTDMELHCV